MIMKEKTCDKKKDRKKIGDVQKVEPIRLDE